MTPDLQAEFRSLSEKARRELKNVPASGSHRRVFSFWAFPSFTPALRCSIYSPLPRKEVKAFAEFSIWRTDVDLEKLRSPVERLKHPRELEPTMHGEIVWLTGEEVAEMEQRIRGIPIPIFLAPPTWAGIDGTGFEFEYNEPFYGVAIHWWEDQPSEWRPFTQTITRIVGELDDRRKTNVQPKALPPKKWTPVLGFERKKQP